MGKNKSRSILGDFTGKLGPVVLSTYRGTPTIRSLSATSKKPASSKQLGQREIFRLVGQLCRQVKEIIKIGYQPPKNPKMSPLNAATSYHMKNCIVGDPNNPDFDFAKFRLSCPIRKTEQAWKAKISASAGNTVAVQWKLNPYPQKYTQLDDKVYLVFYHTTFHRFYSFRKVCKRSDLMYSYTFNELFTGQELFCYQLLVSADGKRVSDTQYLGRIDMI